MSEIERETTAESLLAEFIRNDILDAQTFADYFHIGEVSDMSTRFYEDSISFTFTREE